MATLYDLQDLTPRQRLDVAARAMAELSEQEIAELTPKLVDLSYLRQGGTLEALTVCEDLRDGRPIDGWRGLARAGDGFPAWCIAADPLVWPGAPPRRRFPGGYDPTAILVCGPTYEGAYGDWILAARYIAELRALCGRLLLCAPARLHALLGRCDGVDVAVPFDRQAQALESATYYQCPLTMPSVLSDGYREDRPRYLKTDPAKVAAWRGRLEPETRNIGLLWSRDRGPVDHLMPRAMDRAAPFEAIEPLLHLPGITWHGLAVRGGAAYAEMRRAGAAVRDWSDRLTDFDETAALIDALDAVVSIDSAVANLAGALGRPVHVAVPSQANWKWGSPGSATTPWYPTARVYWPERPGDWRGVFERIATALHRPESAARFSD